MLGLIGLGRMGSGIAATLLRAGFPLMVSDLDSARVSVAVERGAVAARDSGELISACDTVLLSLPGSRVCVKLIEGEILPRLSPGLTVIDFGTTVVRETKRLAARFQSAGASFVDAPVSGGDEAAARGGLFVFVGGEKHAVSDQWRVLLTIGGARVTHCGPSGSGQVVKAVNQLSMGLADAAFLEALAFGVNAGVDVDTIDRAVGGDNGFRSSLRSIAARVAAGGGDEIDAKYAEYEYFLDEANASGFPSPMLDALYEFQKERPPTGIDNMNRPYPPLWSALTNH